VSIIISICISIHIYVIEGERNVIKNHSYTELELALDGKRLVYVVGVRNHES